MKRTISLLLVAIIISVNVMFPTFLGLNDTVSAQSSKNTSGNFVDKTRIDVGGSIYLDRNPFDDNQEYTFKDSNGCTNKFKIDSGDFSRGNSSGKSDLTATIKYEKRNGRGDCESDGEGVITLKNRQVRYVLGYRIDNKTIFMPVILEDGVFNGGTESKGGRYTVEKVGDEEYLLEGSDGNYDNGGSRILYKSGDKFTYQVQTCSGACSQSFNESLLLANGGEASTPDATLYPNASDSESDSNPDGTGETTQLEDCSDKGIGWNPINWISSGLDWFGCEVAKKALGVLDFASAWLADNLETTATTSAGSESSKADGALKQVWSNVLTIANVMFVIGFLLMILSTALGIGAVDAYTVKKFLPRIIIAAIAANLSWYVVAQAIEITNAIGGSLHDIIISPLKNVAGADIKDAFSGSTGASLAAIITAGAIPAIMAVFSGGIFVFVPAVLSLLFAALVAIVVIMIRKLLIFGLIIISPLAISMWAIPGMDKWASRWWKLLIEMLMVYPYIMGLFALGEFASILVLMTNPSKSSNPIPGLTAIALLCIPLFLLPTVFKLASSTLGNLTGMVNNKGKGLFDKGSNWGRERAGKTKRNMDKDLRKGWREQTKHHHVEKEAFDSLDKNKAPEKGIRSKFHRNRDISAQIQRAAQQKASSEDLAQADFALQSNGQGGIDYRNPDGSKKFFDIKRKDGSVDKLEKDDALREAILGAEVYDGVTGEVLSDGTKASQRAAAMYATKQGLAPVAHKTIAGMKSMMASGDPKQIEQAQRASAVFQEAMQANVGSMMPKMPSYFKGPGQAYGRVEASSFQNFAPEEVTDMIKWASDKQSFTKDGVYDQAAHGEAWQRIGQSVQRVVEDPTKYSASPEALKAFTTAINDPGVGIVPGSLTDDMINAIGKIDTKTGVIK